MKKALNILLSAILTAITVISVFPFTASAAQTNKMSLSVKEKKENQTVVSVILPEAKKLEVIDFSFIISAENAEIKTLSTKGTDTEKLIVDLKKSNKKNTNKKSFVYKATNKDGTLTFSGYFVSSLTTDKNFHLCDIIIENDGKFSKTDTFTLEYTLTGKNGTESGNITYYPAKKDMNETTVNQDYPMGDVSLDGSVNSDDARKILRVSVGLDSLSLNEYPFADTDYDGSVTSADARNALRTAVGLEKSVMHRFIISLNGDKKNCKKGGTYTFFCEVTGKTFTMKIKNGGHFCPDTGCYNSGKCIICNKKVQNATDHVFDEKGNCNTCGANKKELKKIKDKLIPLVEEVRTYDLLADDSLSNYKKADFLSFAQDSALSLRKAAKICEDIKGFEDISDKLSKAYKVRFDAFIACMDENGEILSDTANCTTIQNAVRFSYMYLDTLDYLK